MEQQVGGGGISFAKAKQDLTRHLVGDFVTGCKISLDFGKIIYYLLRIINISFDMSLDSQRPVIAFSSE